ncbi:MAG: hypothetical protein DRP01_06970 [Archaeoglobales archaeon]|nr:MAG: hypothetical protein DRP01_06970 [Archaeoglobales archaeon]
MIIVFLTCDELKLLKEIIEYYRNNHTSYDQEEDCLVMSLLKKIEHGIELCNERKVEQYGF